MSQPPLSRQIQDLEYQVGAQLLCRSSRAVTLTPAGEVLLAESKRILSHVDRCLQAVRRTAACGTESLSVGYSAFLDGTFLPAVRTAVAGTLQQASFHFQCLDAEEQICMLRNGTLDAGLVLLPIENADQIRIEQLFRLPAVALVAGSHPFSKYGRISLREIASGDVVEVADVFMRRACHHVEHIARMCGVAIRVKRYAPDLERLFQHIRHSESVAVLPCCAQRLAGPGICCVPIVEREADFTFGVAHRRDRDDSLLKRLLETIHDVNLHRSPRCAHTCTH